MPLLRAFVISVASVRLRAVIDTLRRDDDSLAQFLCDDCI